LVNREARALALSGINTLYGDSHVLHDVSFSLQAGRLLALLGRNGAGKTTCIHTIIGFVAPRDGTVELFGEPVTGLSPEVISRRGVALVPQGRRIFPSLTVRENLAVAYHPRADSVRPWALGRVLDTFPNLAERQGQTAGSLSGGEQQMLAIARALMSNPRVLLMDEPSEGLAPRIVAEVGETVARLKAEGLSILLVEQNLQLALELADEVTILNTGRIVFTGPVNEVRGNDALVAQHLGIVQTAGSLQEGNRP
jgi:branched-chain amino acid transport system ATP-binding protein